MTPAFADSHNTALISEIDTKLAQHDIEYDASTLTDQQLGMIQNILNGGDDANAKKAAIMAILKQ